MRSSIDVTSSEYLNTTATVATTTTEARTFCPWRVMPFSPPWLPADHAVHGRDELLRVPHLETAS